MTETITKKMTLERSVQLVPNRFELVLLAIPRAKAIKNGARPNFSIPHGVSIVETVFLELENGFTTVNKLQTALINSIHGVSEEELQLDMDDSDFGEELSEDMVRRINNFYKNNSMDFED